eukprot:284819575_2
MYRPPLIEERDSCIGQKVPEAVLYIVQQLLMSDLSDRRSEDRHLFTRGKSLSGLLDVRSESPLTRSCEYLQQNRQAVKQSALTPSGQGADPPVHFSRDLLWLSAPRLSLLRHVCLCTPALRHEDRTLSAQLALTSGEIYRRQGRLGRSDVNRHMMRMDASKALHHDAGRIFFFRVLLRFRTLKESNTHLRGPENDPADWQVDPYCQSCCAENKSTIAVSIFYDLVFLGSEPQLKNRLLQGGSNLRDGTRRPSRQQARDSNPPLWELLGATLLSFRSWPPVLQLARKIALLL